MDVESIISYYIEFVFITYVTCIYCDAHVHKHRPHSASKYILSLRQFITV